MVIRISLIAEIFNVSEQYAVFVFAFFLRFLFLNIFFDIRMLLLWILAKIR